MQPAQTLSVPIAHGGPITDSILDDVIAQIDATAEADEYTVNGTYLRLIVGPLMRELRQRRIAMSAIQSLTEPGNVVVLERERGPRP
ncbi:MAG: hypothetical protein ACK4LQ_02230 [Pararhodobacter sp.]